MNARQQARLVVALALVCALASAVGAVAGRGVRPTSGSLLGEAGAPHVIWSVSAALGQLLAQSWIALFGIGSMRVLRRSPVPPPAHHLRWSLLIGPPFLIGLFVLSVVSGIGSFSSARPSLLHELAGWAVGALAFAVVAWEWRGLEALESRFAVAEVEAEPASRSGMMRD